MQMLEANWSAIRDEYLAVAAHAQAWHEKNLHNGLWDTIGLYEFGKWTARAPSCPITVQCLQAIPCLFLAGFSVLRPQCKIHPHVGYSQEVLRGHLGLVCPPSAWIEVAGERYSWQEGQVMVFDDTQLHKAANESNQARVILIADFFR